MSNILDFNNALNAKELDAYLERDNNEERKAKVIAGLQAEVENFVAWLFPAAIITPRNAKVGNVHGSPGTSLVIETRGAKRGVWCDFADPNHSKGDLISLYMAARNVQFPQALEELAEWVGHGSRPEVRYSREQALKKMKRFDRELGPRKGEWHYTDAEGTIIASVYRFEPEGGGKEFLPWDAVKRRYGNPDIRPLYNLPGILQSSRVVVTEGEKAAQHLIDRGICATCVMGGSNSPLERTDLEPLAGKEIIIWPDADEPGRKFGASFAQAVEPIAKGVRVIELPEGKPEGWDAADTDQPEAFLGMSVTPSEAKPALPFFWFSEAEPDLAANDFVENMLTNGSMSVIYGPSNCGKTFFVLDMALHVAWGVEWRGHAVDRGAIVYLSLEGAQGVRNRISAFRKHHGIDELPFIAMPKPVNLLDDQADVSAVIQLVKHVASVTGLPVRMVIVDTLSRAMAGGNENSPEDMTALIGNCDRIRDETGAHLCVVHHSGKDEARGARGHSSLRAATDTEIEIKRDPNLTRSTVRVAKQRDLEAADPFAFTLKSVALGTNRRGKDVTSCVVLEADETVELARSEHDLSPKESEAFACLIDLCSDPEIDPETGEISDVPPLVSMRVWKEAMEQGGTLNGNNPESAKVQFRRIKNALKNKKKIYIDGGNVQPRGTWGNTDVEH